MVLFVGGNGLSETSRKQEQEAILEGGRAASRWCNGEKIITCKLTSIPADIDILLCLSQAPFSHSSSSSLSSGWSSDSEDPAPSPQLQPPALILDTNLEQANGGVKKTEEEEGWGSSEGASPDTSFDDY